MPCGGSADPPEPAPPEEAPYKVVCPACGTDGDDPQVTIWLGEAIEGPGAEHMLQEIRCAPCGAASDVAVLMGTIPDELRDVLREGVTPAGVALLDRHLASREEFAEQARAARGAGDREDELDLPEPVDLGDLDLGPLVEAAGSRLVAVPARALAAARGVRTAAEAAPDAALPVTLLLDGFVCVVSMDWPAREVRAGDGRLHVSLSHPPNGLLTPSARRVVLPLFFASHEMAFLIVEPGSTRPVEHYYLPIQETGD